MKYDAHEPKLTAIDPSYFPDFSERMEVQYEWFLNTLSFTPPAP